MAAARGGTSKLFAQRQRHMPSMDLIFFLALKHWLSDDFGLGDRRVRLAACWKIAEIMAGVVCMAYKAYGLGTIPSSRGICIQKPCRFLRATCCEPSSRG